MRHVAHLSAHVARFPPFASVVQHLRRDARVSRDNRNQMISRVPPDIHRGRPSALYRCWPYADTSLGRFWRYELSIRLTSGAAGARIGQLDRHSSRWNRWICRCADQTRDPTAENGTCHLSESSLTAYQFKAEHDIIVMRVTVHLYLLLPYRSGCAIKNRKNILRIRSDSLSGLTGAAYRPTFLHFLIIDEERSVRCPAVHKCRDVRNDVRIPFISAGEMQPMNHD